MPTRRGSPCRKPTRKQALTLGYSAPWEAATEAADPRTCPTCGGELVTLERETVCLACTRSGRDAELKAEREWDDMMERRKALLRAAARRNDVLARLRRRAAKRGRIEAAP